MNNLKFAYPITVSKPFLPPIEDYQELIRGIWNTRWLTNFGPMHSKLEEELEAVLGVSNVSLFTNGHSALETSMRCLELTGEVITTPFTFASTAHAISLNGLMPKFCDIEPQTFNIDPAKIESLINERTSAILAVHVFGNPCDVEAIDNIAKKYQLKVIYDAAHAFKVKLNGKGIGCYGDLSMFSFHATKVFHSIEGGALCFNNRELKKKLYLLKNFGIANEEEVLAVAPNAKMNEFQAAMGLVNLRYIDNEISERKRIANLYRNLISGLPGIEFIDDSPGVEHNYAYFPIRVYGGSGCVERNELYEMLKAYNIFTRKYFYPLCSHYECYQHLSPEKNTPVAQQVSDQILTLPIYGDLKNSEVEQICDAIKACTCVVSSKRNSRKKGVFQDSPKIKEAVMGE